MNEWDALRETVFWELSEELNVIRIFDLNYLVDHVRTSFSLFLWLTYY